jgi:hypothetical protein
MCAARTVSVSATTDLTWCVLAAHTNQKVDGALDLLATFVSESPDRVYPYFLMLKGILDYIDNLSVPQVRTLFRMLCDLGVSQSETGGEADEIHIFIRKMLAKGELRDARVGVVGVVAMLQSYANLAPQTGVPAADVGGGAEPDSAINGTKESLLLLKVVKERFIDTALGKNRLPFREEMAKALGLFCDELARVFADGIQFSPTVFDFVDEHFASPVFQVGATTISFGMRVCVCVCVCASLTFRSTNTPGVWCLSFQELYLVAADEPLPKNVGDTEVTMCKAFDLNDAEDAEDESERIHVNILPALLAPDQKDRQDPAYFLPMCPLFNLAQVSGVDLSCKCVGLSLLARDGVDRSLSFSYLHSVCIALTAILFAFVALECGCNWSRTKLEP